MADVVCVTEGDCVVVCDGVGCWLPDVELEPDSLGVGDALREPVLVPLPLVLGEVDWLGDSDLLLEGDGVTVELEVSVMDGDGVTLGVGACEGDTLGDEDSVTDWLGVTDCEGVCDLVPEKLGDAEAESVCDSEGVTDCDCEGDTVVLAV